MSTAYISVLKSVNDIALPCTPQMFHRGLIEKNQCSYHR